MITKTAKDKDDIESKISTFIETELSPSRRTASPLGSELESEPDGLIVLINRKNHIL